MLDADKTGESNLSSTPAANSTLELNHQQLRFFKAKYFNIFPTPEASGKAPNLRHPCQTANKLA